MEEFAEKLKKQGRTLFFSVLGIFFVMLTFSIILQQDSAVEAATPPTIVSYQGKLLVGGSLASSTVSMTFRLYDDPTAGSEKYNSGAVSVTPQSGLFSVELGGNDGAVIDPTIFKDNAALYLQVTIGAENLSPRKRITTAPYALNALYLDGRIATSTPTSTSYVPLADNSGNFNFNKVTSTEVYVSATSSFNNGTAFFVPFDGTSILSLGNITSNSGLLSILGTTGDAPTILMGTGDVYGDEFNVSIGGGNSPSIALNYNSVSNNGLEIGANASGGYIESTPSSTTLKFVSNIAAGLDSYSAFEFRTNNTLTGGVNKYLAAWYNNTTNVMVLSPEGTLLVNALGVAGVGIETTALTSFGTVSVGTDLTIGGINYTPYFIDSVGTNGYLWKSDGDGRGTWVSTSSLGIIGDLPPGSTGQVFRYGSSSWEATSSLFIADSGFVGIGTTTPNLKLTIANDGGMQAMGTYGSGTLLATSTGSQFIWYPRKSSLMAGHMESSYEYWSDGMVGSYTASFGRDNRTGADYAFAAGSGNNANGTAAVAIGYGNQASAEYSSAFGSGNLSLGNYGATIGRSNRTDGEYSIAMGYTVRASSTSAFAWGYNYTLTTDYSLSIGRDDADFIFTPGESTATNTVAFSTVTQFNNNVASTTGALAYILNAPNFASTSPDQYILSLRSNNTPVFSVASNGNVHALGTLSASSATVGTPGTPGDLAERVDIAIDDTAEAGDVLTVDEISPDTYRRTSGSYDASVSGVVSTNPTIVVGNGKTDYTAVMAMVGRVPVKASAENGPINRGDLLVSASLPGHAMRYDPTKDDTRVVGVIGVALDSLPSGSGKIMALIRTGWVYNRNQSIQEIKSNLETLAAVQGLSLGSNPNNLEVQNTGGALNYTSGNLNLQGFAILNVGRVIGVNGRWIIDGNGRLISKVQTSEGEKTLYSVNSYSDELIISGSDKLTSGEARINFDQATREIINSDETLKVNVTLTSGEATGIYVKEKNEQGFVVKETGAGQSNATFDWVVIAKRKPVPTPEPPAEVTNPPPSSGNNTETPASSNESSGGNQVNPPTTDQGAGETSEAPPSTDANASPDTNDNTSDTASPTTETSSTPPPADPVETTPALTQTTEAPVETGETTPGNGGEALASP